MKRILALILVLSMAISLGLVGCGTKNSSTSTETSAVASSTVVSNSTASNDSTATVAKDPVKVKFMAYNKEESRKTYLEYLKTNITDVTIEYNFVDLKQFMNILNTQLAAGEGPDLIEGGGDTTTLAAAGYLEDLTNASFISKYNDTGFQAYKYQDKIYGVPLQSWYEGIYYNKDIFAKYGLTPPKTLDQWIIIHETLKKNGIKPQTMGAKSWEPMMKQSIGLVLNEFYSLEAAKGFEDKFNAGQITLDGNWNAAVKAWSKVIEAGCLTKDMLGLDYDPALNEFATGKAAMWESGPWALTTIKAANPNINLGMFPIPGLNEGSGWLIGGPGSSLCINKNSKVKDAVLRILDVTSTPEAQAALVKDNPGSSFLKGVSVDLGPEFADCSQAFADGHVYAPWVYWLGGNDIALDYGKALQDVLSGKKTTDEAIKVADATAVKVRKSLAK